MRVVSLVGAAAARVCGWALAGAVVADRELGMLWAFGSRRMGLVLGNSLGVGCGCWSGRGYGGMARIFW